MIFTAGQPGDLTRYVTPDSKNASISLFLRDHKGETLRKVIGRAQEFIDAHPMKEARFRLAGGYGGLLAAINEEVAALDARITLAAFGAVFVCCLLAYRSLVAGVLFLLPLMLSNYMTYARHYPFLERTFAVLGRDLERTVEFFRHVDRIKPSTADVMAREGIKESGTVEFVRAYESAAVKTIAQVLAEWRRTRRLGGETGSTD
jgi:hypothetical protein